jgi:hypothetical protein
MQCHVYFFLEKNMQCQQTLGANHKNLENMHCGRQTLAMSCNCKLLCAYLLLAHAAVAQSPPSRSLTPASTGRYTFALPFVFGNLHVYLPKTIHSDA